MDENHDSQQHQLQGRLSESLDNPKATSTPPLPATTVSSPPPPPTPPQRHLSTASRHENTSESSPNPAAAAATASPQDYCSQHSPLSDENYTRTSWSPQSGSPSLPASSGGDSSRAQQSAQGPSPPQQAATPGNKRKHPSVSIDPQLRSPSLASPAISNEQERQQQQQQQPQQAPKKQRRASKAKGRSQSAGSDKEMSQERPRLTEQEKKNNHIVSEQKRRLAIREGFDRLTEIVPGLGGQGRSESIVLKKSVDYMREVLQERQMLIERIQALGGEIPPELR